MIRKFLPSAILISFFVFLLFGSLWILEVRLVPTNLKTVTEQWMGQFLGVPVRVNRIRVGWFRHLSLGGLEINWTKTALPLLVDVERIVVRYDFASLIKRNFQIPTKIFLDSPHFAFESLHRRGSLVDMRLLMSERGFLTRFDFEDGKLEAPWFRAGEKLTLMGIRGHAIPKNGSIFDFELQGRLEGAASGALKVIGELDIEEKTVRFSAQLKDVFFKPESRIPVEALNGAIEVSSRVVDLHDVSFLIRGVPCQLNGTITDLFSEEAVFDLSFQTVGDRLPVQIEVDGDLREQSISGIARFNHRNYRFQGSLVPRHHAIELERIIMNDRYQASGLLDYRAGTYEFNVENEEKRAKVDLVLDGFSGRLTAQLDHFDFFDYDVVTYATLEFAPTDEFLQDGLPIFDLYVETDYLVFEHHVLRDFHGKARLSAHGLHDILARWGNLSTLRGHVSFHEKPEADVVIQMGPLPLGRVQSLGNSALPRSLGGNLEGKLYVRGFLGEPDLEGAFTIKQGKIGSFEYDRAQIHFFGQFPYLPLSDSKVWKGKHSFPLKGGFDFTLRNFLQGVDIVNTERVVIWKGIELSQALDDVVTANETAVPTSSVVPARAVGLQDSRRKPKKVGAEYQLGDRTSVELVAEEGNQSQHDYVTVGPKVKF